MAGALVGLVLALMQGTALVWWLWPGRAKPVLVLPALSLLAGLATSSSAYFLWTVASGGRTSWFPGLEVLASAALAWSTWRRSRARRWRAVRPRGLPPARAWVAPLALMLVTGIVLLLLGRGAAVMPWGHWDAWNVINLKARFLCAGGPGWRWVFEGPGMHHPDYPLLLSCSVARLWRWSAFLGEPGFSALQPQVLSLLTWLACLLALVAAVARLCVPGMAPLAGLAFFVLGWDLLWGSMQYADFAQAGLSVWSAAVLALALRRRGRARRWWPLFGFLVGATAWCKNEGLAFAAVLLLAFALLARASWRDWGRLAGGGLVAGLSVAVLKLVFAARSGVFEARTRSVWTDLADPERYRVLAGFAREHVASYWTLSAVPVLVLAAFLLPRRSAARRSWLPLGLCLALALVFVLVMITTRYPYDWHVATVVDRLLIQLWPLAILAGSTALRPA